MRSVVLKIGGGVLRNKDCFDRTVSVIKGKTKEYDGVIIVLSALYGVTDFLIASTQKTLSHDKEIMKVIEDLEKIHVDYLQLIKNAAIRQKAEFMLREKISLLEKFLYGINYLKEVSPRSKDLIQSFGERLSPIVLEAFLLDAGVPATFIDAEDAGIVCKGPFENALVDLPATTTNFQQNISPLLGNKVVLLPGYYGVDENNDVKTFGRGGTDYSAGFIANVFEAHLEIWKDVSGFMTADPKIVKTAKQIPLLSYSEAEELGYLGAKILHPKTIDPLRQKGLSAEVKNLFAPEVKGTIISAEKGQHDLVVKSIAAMGNVALVTVKSTNLFQSIGFASLIFSRLTENGVSIDLIATSETSISFSIDAKNLERALLALEPLSAEYNFTIIHKKDLARLGVIGEGMKETPGIAGKIFGAIARAGISTELISQGASEINVSFVVPQEKLHAALLAVHDECIPKNGF